MTRDCFRSASATIRVMRWTVPVLLAALAAGCAYHAPGAPTPVITTPSTTPASIRLTGSSRPDRGLDIIATVLTASGAFVPGVPVSLSTSSGSLSPTGGVTDGNGAFRSILAIGGNATVFAQAAGLTTSVNVLGTPDNTTAPPPPTPPLPPVTPTPAPLTVSIAVAGSPTAGTATTFGLSTQALSSAVWNFGDGQTLTTTATGQSTHTYAAAGTYNVSATVTDMLGRTASASTSVVVAPAPGTSGGTPTAQTVAATIGCTPPTVHPGSAQCNASATYGGATVASDKIYGVTWDWGDGNVETTPGPLHTHLYAQAGAYLVTAAVGVVTATDGSKIGTTSQKITIP